MEGDILSELKEKTINRYIKAIEKERNARIHTDQVRKQIIKETTDSIKKAVSPKFSMFLYLNCSFAVEDGLENSIVAEYLAKRLLHGKFKDFETNSAFFVEISEFKGVYGNMEFEEILNFLETELKVLFKNVSFSKLSSPVALHGDKEKTAYQLYLKTKDQ